jgi:UDP-N-acetylglucosamine--N-acetylmuramyl-(pentapeptide) pyrophosphoryl-undecaprenol N-acetylglucosamine transferase
MKILVTGGHLTPALSVIDYILANQKDELIFVGRKFSQDKKQVSQEQTQIESRKIPFFFLDGIKTSDLHGLNLVKSIPLFINSLLQAYQILKKTKPDVILSFGGYLALPVAITGYLRKIPILTHEQTQVIGFSNRLISKLASSVAVSFSHTKELITSNKVVVTGNPLRAQLSAKVAKPTWFKNESALPILYITGGNQGSKTINDFVAHNLSWLLENWLIIHQCGNPTKDHDYPAELLAVKKTLPEKLQLRYFVLPWVEIDQLAWIYQHADAAFSRAGANTVMELIRFSIPTILVPLPFSHLDEQMKNALWYQNLGGAIILPQDQLNSQTTQAKILNFAKTTKMMRQQIDQQLVNHNQEAAALIYQQLVKIKK